MALRNKTTGEYLKIGKEQMLSKIVVNIFQNQTHRQEGSNAYHKHKTQLIPTNKLLERLDPDILDEIAKECYAILKEEKESKYTPTGVVVENKYKNWEDC